MAQANPGEPTGSSLARRFGEETYVNLETFRKNGTAVRTPVWVARVDDKLYVVTDGTSAKVKRLRRNPRIRLAPCGAMGAISGDWVEGRGCVLDDHARIERANAALLAKYGIQFRLLNLASWLGGRIGRRAILELELAGPPSSFN